MSAVAMNTVVARRAVATASARILAEPAALVVAGVFYLMVTSVLAALWSTAADAGDGTVVGYTSAALVWYVATSEAATIALPIRLIETIGEDIASSRVEVELLRPVSALTVRVATEVGTMLPRLAVCVALGLTFAAIVAGAPPDAGAVLLAGPALLLAVVLNLVAQHAFAGAAFWVRDATGTWFLYQKLVFVLGGMLIPLEVLPGWLETTARVLPFMAMAYAPARLASGHFEPELLTVQLGWLAVLWFVADRTFAAGERHLLGVGA